MLALKMIKKFPKFDNSWPDEDKLRWFKSFAGLVDFVLGPSDATRRAAYEEGMRRLACRPSLGCALSAEQRQTIDGYCGPEIAGSRSDVPDVA